MIGSAFLNQLQAPPKSYDRVMMSAAKSAIKTWNELEKSCDFLNGRPIGTFSASQLMSIEIKELRADLERKATLLRDCSTCLAHLDSVSPSPLGAVRKLIGDISKELL